MAGGRPRRSEVGDWARRAQSIGEWPGLRVTSLEVFLGTLEWEGGGARVDDPGWRFGAVRRERFGAGRSDEEGEAAAAAAVVVLLLLVLFDIGARVGMRRGVVGTGGGAMRLGVRGLEFVLSTAGGGGGGGIMLVEVGVEVAVAVEGCCIRIAGSSVVVVVVGSERVKLGMASSSLSVADAFGVGWSSSPPSASSWSFFFFFLTSSSWICSGATGSFSSALLIPFAPASLFRGRGIDFWWRKLAKKLENQAGRRKQNRTTDATMRETPIRAMIRFKKGGPSVAGA